jgi:NAD(P)H-hydrate epimerase
LNDQEISKLNIDKPKTFEAIMRRIVTAEEMRIIDQMTIQEIGVPGLLLMENAGLGVVDVVEDLLCETDGNRILILCGKGNNGGDGMVVARHLFNRGKEVHVFLIGEKNKLKGDALTNMRILEGFQIAINEITEKKQLKRLPESDLIVDALLGTGVTGEVTGLLADAIRWINACSAPVVSVDLPSGLHSNDGTFQGVCIKASRTATMAELKRGLVLPPGRDLAGDVSVVDIGSPEFAAQKVGIQTFLLESSDILKRIPPRPRHAHKGDFGKIAVLAGSPGMTGAATLTSLASLRVGGGLTILGVPSSLNPILEEKCTEVMTRPLPETTTGTVSLNAKKEIDTLVKWADALAIGPGLSMDPETRELVRIIVTGQDIPMVIDADGINAFIGATDLLKKKKGDFILTPHAGELSRLINKPIETIRFNRIEVARECASSFQCVFVLKGSPTVIADPDGFVYLNPTGNSGMATAGSGDVLTGMIVGFMGQGVSTMDSAICGVYLHGMTGDVAANAIGERSLLSGDLLDFIGETFCRL